MPTQAHRSIQIPHRLNQTQSGRMLQFFRHAPQLFPQASTQHPCICAMTSQRAVGSKGSYPSKCFRRGQISGAVCPRGCFIGAGQIARPIRPRMTLQEPHLHGSGKLRHRSSHHPLRQRLSALQAKLLQARPNLSASRHLDPLDAYLDCCYLIHDLCSGCLAARSKLLSMRSGSPDGDSSRLD